MVAFPSVDGVRRSDTVGRIRARVPTSLTKSSARFMCWHSIHTLYVSDGFKEARTKTVTSLEISLLGETK